MRGLILRVLHLTKRIRSVEPTTGENTTDKTARRADISKVKGLLHVNTIHLIVDIPIRGNATEQLIRGKAAQQPIRGKAAQQPIRGKTTEQIRGKAVQQPITGKAAQQPTKETAAVQIDACKVRGRLQVQTALRTKKSSGSEIIGHLSRKETKQHLDRHDVNGALKKSIRR
nr:hypothetical protein BaRGS_006523 [Batillaria attramentaria]